MNKNKDLSIIITTRNRKKDLLRCIDSIKASNFNSIIWEIVIIDDNSSDGTEKIKTEDLKISNGVIIHNNQQQMMVKSRNIGIRKSNGKYLLFIDDDNVVDPNMIKMLFSFSKKNKEYGIIGPSMHYLHNKKKYLDYQRINFFTGKTSGIVDNSKCNICDSDGIPNAFLIKREVLKKTNFFDEKLVQTFTEPDLAFTANKFGYKCGILKDSIIYHDVTCEDKLTARALGGQFNQKAYCLMRNRTVIISRYGQWYQKIIYIIFFSWFWPLSYSLIMLKSNRADLILLYWLGFFDGVKYFFGFKLSNNTIIKYIYAKNT